jgi:hypothetical protein
LFRLGEISSRPKPTGQFSTRARDLMDDDDATGTNAEVIVRIVTV